MNTKRKMAQGCVQSNPSPSVVIPDDLIVDILCLLKVKPLMKMKCVSKSWNTLISDPKFVKMHLNRSAQNPGSYLVSYKNSKKDLDVNTDHYSFGSFVPFSISDLMENGSINLPNDPYYQLIDKDCCEVVGSCNGLVCFLCCSSSKDDVHNEVWLRLWNPATRTISNKSGYFRDDKNDLNRWKFTFGYDNSTDTYKVVAIYFGPFGPYGYNMKPEVQVLSFGDNIWRKIQNFSARPFWFNFSNYGTYAGVSVQLNCTVNWSAYIKNGDFVNNYVIISLDLSTEIHTKLLPPPVSLGVSVLQQGIGVLMDSLCFYHNFEETDFIMWMMTKFGDDKSWTQFLKLSYSNFEKFYINGTSCFNLVENGDTLILAHPQQDRAILYNWRNNRVVETNVNKDICWLSINNYVESLVSTG